MDAMLGNTPKQAVLRNRLKDRKLPVRGWGCVTLAGDAFHIMTPHLGQGAGVALEDAVKLG